MKATVPGGVLVSGNLVCDLLVRPVEEIRWGASMWIDAMERSVGGNGANTAYAAAKMGARTRLLGLVGEDEEGAWILAQLEAAGVDTSYLGRCQAATAASVVLVRSGGERCFLHRPGASREAFPAPLDFPPALAGGFTHYHLGAPFALPLQRPHLAETLRRARAVGLGTSLDTQWDSRGEWMTILAPALPETDILFVNEDEAVELVGVSEPRAVATAFRGLGVTIVVLKRGPRGCAVLGPDLDFRQPAFDVPVVDTTGAGDCFAGAYLAALSRGGSHIEAARLASGVSAMTVQHLGAVAGLRSYAETCAWCEAAKLRYDA